jgi:hypothetical protein
MFPNVSLTDTPLKLVVKKKKKKKKSAIVAILVCLSNSTAQLKKDIAEEDMIRSSSSMTQAP